MQHKVGGKATLCFANLESDTSTESSSLPASAAAHLHAIGRKSESESLDPRSDPCSKQMLHHHEFAQGPRKSRDGVGTDPRKKQC